MLPGYITVTLLMFRVYIVSSRPTSQAAHYPQLLLSFGAGPRTCLGRHLAKLQAVVAIATLVRRFRVRLAVGHERIEEHMQFVLLPSHLNIVLEPRE